MKQKKQNDKEINEVEETPKKGKFFNDPIYYILKKHKTISKLRKHFYKLYYSGVVIEYELYGDFKDIKMITSNKNIHYKQIHFNIFQYKSWINLLKQRYEDTWYCMFIFNKIPKSGYMKLSYL